MTHVLCSLWLTHALPELMGLSADLWGAWPARMRQARTLHFSLCLTSWGGTWSLRGWKRGLGCGQH